MLGPILKERKTLQGRVDPRRIRSESGRFSSRLQCEAYMGYLSMARG